MNTIIDVASLKPNEYAHKTARKTARICIDELNLSDITLNIEICDQLPNGTSGDVLLWELNQTYFTIRVIDNHELVITLAHEMYHVWQWINQMDMAENMAEMYGQRVGMLMIQSHGG